MLELRGMTREDLPLVDRWLREPHVARWWLAGTTAEAEIDELRAHVDGESDGATQMLTVLERHDRRPNRAVPIGWCQWYPYDAYPDEARAIGAHPGDCGIDYALGDPEALGRGLGAQLIAALVAEVHRHRPRAGIVVDPDANNAASRRVLERNGFSLVAIRPVSTEPDDNPMAIYRLDEHQAASEPRKAGLWSPRRTCP